MIGENGVLDTVRRRYSVKTASILVCVVVLTLALGVFFAGHVVNGTEGTLEDRAIAAIAALLVVFVAHLALVGILVGGNIALALRQLSTRTERIGEGEFDVDLETERIDEVGTLYDSVAEMRDSLETTLVDLEREQARAREAQRAAERQNKQLLAEADRFSDVMAACADGDLTQRLEPETDDEAMAAIAAAFNEMVDQLEAVVAQGQAVAQSLDRTSTELQLSAEEIREANADVSDGIQEIADGSSRQTDQLEVASSEVSSLSSTTEEVASTTSEIADRSDRVADLADDGRDAAAAARTEIRESVATTQEVVETIETLDEEAQRIEEVIALIDEIAQRTDMLAVNAAIEASRADGDAGGNGSAGFGAVADEVKDLSRETQAAVEEIETTLESIQERAATGADGIETVDERITATAETIDDLRSHLEEISEGVNWVNDGLQSIDAAAAEQAESAGEIATIVDDVATVSAETTQQSQEVAGAAEETAATASQVSDKSTTLDQQARQLATTLDVFAADGDGGPDALESTAGGGSV